MRYALVVLVVSVSSVFGQTTGEAEMVFNREFNAAKAVFDARVKAAQDKYVIVLKEELKKLTQKGDLDGAVAINEKIKSLEDMPKTNKTKDIALIGKWSIKTDTGWNGIYNFNNDGTISTKDGIKYWIVEENTLIILDKNKEKVEWYKLPLTNRIIGEKRTNNKIEKLTMEKQD